MTETIRTASRALLLAVLAVASRAGAQPTYDLAIDGASSFSGASGASVDIGGVYDLNLTEAGNDTVDGAQGWSISVSSDGVAITSITTDGTVAADVNDDPPGLRNTGFGVSETTTAFREGGECAGDGAVSAIVLSFVMNITLPVNESSNIAKIETAGSADAPAFERSPRECCHRATAEVASISFVQGCQGSGQPVRQQRHLVGPDDRAHARFVVDLVDGRGLHSAGPLC